MAPDVLRRRKLGGPRVAPLPKNLARIFEPFLNQSQHSLKKAQRLKLCQAVVIIGHPIGGVKWPIPVGPQSNGPLSDQSCQVQERS